MSYSITANEAANILGVSLGRVHQLIQLGKLEADRIGNIWLIDDDSINARLASKPCAGRPAAARIARNVETEQYILMNRHHEVFSLTCTVGDRRFMTIDEVFDAKRAPIGILGTRGNKASTASFNNWWKHRSIPSARTGISTKTKELGLDTEMQIPFSSFGLSLSDQYWIKPAISNVEWKDINYFNNDFDEMAISPKNAGLDWLSAVGLNSPDNTSDGNLPKKWVRYRGVPTLVKGGGPLNQEPYNESVASELYKRLLTSDEYVPYKLVAGNTNANLPAVCTCTDFISDDEELIPAYYISKYKRKPNHFSEYQHYIDCCASLGVENAELAIERMLVCDDIIANFDRHWRNFGLIRNVETLEFRVAPIFDSGSCLWCNKDLNTLLNGDYSFSTKPFHEDPKRQLRLVQNLEWLDLDTLDGFVDDVHKILYQNPSITNRVDTICSGVQSRIDRLKKII